MSVESREMMSVWLHDLSARRRSAGCGAEVCAMFHPTKQKNQFLRLPVLRALLLFKRHRKPRSHRPNQNVIVSLFAITAAIFHHSSLIGYRSSEAISSLHL